jgi:hypothetical protein
MAPAEQNPEPPIRFLVSDLDRQFCHPRCMLICFTACPGPGDKDTHEIEAPCDLALPDASGRRPARHPGYAIVIDQIRGPGQAPFLSGVLETMAARTPRTPDRPGSRTMALTPDVTVMTITSDQDPHAARHAPGRRGWEVPRLPGPVPDHGTAMHLADTAVERDLPEGHRVWPHIPGWAAKPGLTTPYAITRASEPPERTSNQEHATSRADPEGGL